MDKNDYMHSLLKHIQMQQNEAIEKMLGEAIKKGIITVRQSDPVLIQEPDSDKISLRHSLVIDYLGAEKIEELEKEISELKNKLQADPWRK